MLQSKNKFISEIVNIAKTSSKWYCLDKSRTIRSSGKMSSPEPLIAKYDLQEWMNQSYKGGDVDKLCSPDVSDFYRGLLRTSSSMAPDAKNGGDTK